MMQSPEDDSEGTENISFFADEFSIPDVALDFSKWDKAWEKALRKISSLKVYNTFGTIWRENRWEGAPPLPLMESTLHDRVRHLQDTLAKTWIGLDELGHFVPAWQLLEEGERKRHLWNGLKESMNGSWDQDARALAPEITTSAMLEQHGKAFTDFVDTYANAIKDADPSTVYFLPSEWWQKSIDDKSKLWTTEGEVQFVFKQLSVQRNEYISRFLLNTTMSVLYDLSHGSPGMNPVIDMLKSSGYAATSWAKTLSSIRKKPVLRCENCTKSRDEVGGSSKFMVCSRCKANLDFTVHYCSRACQLEDWHNHKKNCGKQKVSKNLPGTAQDRYWKYPDVPDYLRDNPPPLRDGNVAVNTLGFGKPHPERPHSPALQRQVSLLKGDIDAEYYLFDELERPIRVVIHETWPKMYFRLFRSEAMFSAERRGVEGLAEYLIKVMGSKPGLSRERILDQLSREYGGDVASELAEWERRGANNGEPGSTFLETMSGNMPRMMQLAGIKMPGAGR